MAIYSLNHKAIGKKTQERPYTASAHVPYITRARAMSRLEGARMPVDKAGAMEFLRAGEDRDRANARVADKIMLALPIELTAEQRAALVRRYAEDITKGRAPWLAAFHDKGKDARNPHCHLVIRDRDPETGRRVIGLSENGSTQHLREAWTVHSNRALEEVGSRERIDHRTLAEQGRPGPATIHEGPKGHAMARRGHQPKSQVRSVKNAPQARRNHRNINYPAIDEGQSRGAYNAQAKALRERGAWEAVDAANLKQEMEALHDIHKRPAGQLGGNATKPRKPTRLVDRVQALVVAGVHPQDGVGGLGKTFVRVLDSFTPFGTSRFELGVGAIPPASDRVAGTEAVNVPADIVREFGLSPVFTEPLPLVGVNQGAPPLPHEPIFLNFTHKPVDDVIEEPLRGSYNAPNLIEEPGNRNNHDLANLSNNEDVKGKTMGNDDDIVNRLNESTHAINKSKAYQSKGDFKNLMEKSYADPKEAEKKMDEYRATHGNDALYKKLGDTVRSPTFGQRPGSMLTVGIKGGSHTLPASLFLKPPGTIMKTNGGQRLQSVRSSSGRNGAEGATHRHRRQVLHIRNACNSSARTKAVIRTPPKTSASVS